MNRTGPVQEMHLVIELFIDAAAGIRVQRIPLVNGHHQCTTALKHVTCNMRIVLCNPFLGIKDQNHNIGIGNRLQGFHHRELFNGFKHLAFTTKTGRID